MVTVNKQNLIQSGSGFATPLTRIVTTTMNQLKEDHCMTNICKSYDKNFETECQELDKEACHFDDCEKTATQQIELIVLGEPLHFLFCDSHIAEFQEEVN